MLANDRHSESILPEKSRYLNYALTYANNYFPLNACYICWNKYLINESRFMGMIFPCN